MSENPLEQSHGHIVAWRPARSHGRPSCYRCCRWLLTERNFGGYAKNPMMKLYSNVTMEELDFLSFGQYLIHD